MGKKQKEHLDEIGTLGRVLTSLVLILLGCEHPDSLITNIVIPFREFYLIKAKTTAFVKALKTDITTAFRFLLVIIRFERFLA